MTELYREMKMNSVPNISRWLMDMMEDNGEEMMIERESGHDLLRRYKTWARDSGFEMTAANVNITSFGMDIKKYAGVESKHTKQGNRYWINRRGLKGYLESKGHMLREIEFVEDEEE